MAVLSRLACFLAPTDGRWVPAAMGTTDGYHTRAVDTRATCKKPPSTFCYSIDTGQPEVFFTQSRNVCSSQPLPPPSPPGDGVDSLSARERRNVSRRIGLAWLFLAGGMGQAECLAKKLK